MSLITGFLVSAGGSSPILVFQMAALAMLVSEHSMLEISYPSTEKYLEEGRTLNLVCHISHQQNEASQIEAHWYKRTNKHNETGFGKEMESFRLSQNSDPTAKVMSSLLLQIQNVSQSDSGRYQCRASIKNTVLTAVGHFIRVNVTERTEVDLEVNKALRVDSRLERMWAVFMMSWIIMYVKGVNRLKLPRQEGEVIPTDLHWSMVLSNSAEGAAELDSSQHPRKSPGSVSHLGCAKTEYTE